MRIDPKAFGYFLATILCLWGALSENVLETMVSAATLVIIYFLFFVRKPSPIILFSMLLQWVAVNIKVFWANIEGIKLRDVFSYYTSPDYIEHAFYLSSIGLLALSFGIYWFLKVEYSIEQFKQSFAPYSFKRILIFYFVFSFTVEVLVGLRNSMPGLFQVFYSFSILKWGFFTALVIHAFLFEKKNRSYAIYIALFEFVVGFYSYFSEFKTVILYFAIAVLYINEREFKLKQLLVGALSFYVVFQFGLLWTTVKGDYREFLSQGAQSQQVNVSTYDAFNKLIELINNVDDEALQQNTTLMIDRIGYLDFFSLVIKRVPKYIPYEEGKVWFHSFTHIVTPRILFPNKPAIDDSEHTRKYTGIMVATQSMGVSHSIGYMADAYIDFGPMLMFLPIILLGCLIGATYTNLLYKSFNLYWGCVLSSSVFLFISEYGKNSLKMVSQYVMFLLVVWLFRKYIIKYIDPYLLNDKNTNQ